MQITPEVHLLEATKGSYVYLVLGEEPVLIDTGIRGKLAGIETELGKLGVRLQDLRHILLTHHDVDHIGNAKAIKELSGATLWSSKLDQQVIQGDERRKGLKNIIAKLVRADQPVVDLTYRAGETIAGIEAVETPGHTPGHVSFVYKDILFAGDMVASSRGRLKPSPGFLTWSVLENQRSIKRLSEHSFDWICPAHGQPMQKARLSDAL